MKNFGYSRPSTLREASELLGSEHGKSCAPRRRDGPARRNEGQLGRSRAAGFTSSTSKNCKGSVVTARACVSAPPPRSSISSRADRAATGAASRHGRRQDRHAADTQHGDHRRQCLSATTLLVIPQQLPRASSMAARHVSRSSARTIFTPSWKVVPLSSFTPRSWPRPSSSRSEPSRTSPRGAKYCSCAVRQVLRHPQSRTL